jgi:plasmid maintenance system antidote protein VapI
MAMPRERTHPGEVLKESFSCRSIPSARELARALGIPANRLTEIAIHQR